MTFCHLLHLFIYLFLWRAKTTQHNTTILISASQPAMSTMMMYAPVDRTKVGICKKSTTNIDWCRRFAVQDFELLCNASRIMVVFICNSYLVSAMGGKSWKKAFRGEDDRQTRRQRQKIAGEPGCTSSRGVLSSLA